MKKMMRDEKGKNDCVISTGSVREFERFSYWKETVADNIVRLDIKKVFPDHPFAGVIKMNQIGKLQFASLQSVSQIAARSVNQISKSTEETNYFCFALAGKQHLAGSSFSKVLTRGDWVLLHNSLPYQWFFPGDHAQLILKIPYSKIRARVNLENRDIVYHFPGKKGFGKVVFDTIYSIWSESERIGVQTPPGLDDLIIDLLVNCVADSVHEEEGSFHSRFLRRIEIKTFIKDHLQKPDLNPDFIAESFNISKRYLYSLFADEEPTLGEYIRMLRLEKCKSDIGNPLLLNRSITEICYFWGFNDFSHFSKLFKKTFGLSPRHYRMSKNQTK